MLGSRIVPFIALLALVAAGSGWAQSTQSTVVPIRGEYYDSAAGGLLTYERAITLEWPTATNSALGWPVSGYLVATAWSKGNGASYTLYGYYADFFAGADAATPDLAMSYVAIGYGSTPAFRSTIRVNLAQFSKEEQAVAFAGR